MNTELKEKFKELLKSKYMLKGAPASLNIEALGLLKRVIASLKIDISREGLSISSDAEFNLVDFIKREIDNSKNKLSKFLDAVLHHKKFKDLESKIRGLYYLVTNVESSDFLKIKVLSVKESDIQKDLKSSPDIELTRLFYLIYSNCLDTPGGEPMNMIIYDYYMSSTDAIRKLVTIGAAAHCPIVTGVSPFLFNLQNFSAINQAKCDIHKLAMRTDFMALRRHSESRYLCLVMPSILGRSPYTTDFYPASMCEFYNEYFTSKLPEETLLWINAAFAVGVRVAASQAVYGWAASVLGLDSGGAVTDLPVPFEFRNKVLTPLPPVQAQFTDRREKDLSSLGFIVLCHYKNTNKCVFFSMQTVHAPEKYDDADATANDYLSCSFPNVLLASRFIHTMKVRLRNKIGSFQTKENIQIYLQSWLSKYILLNDLASHEIKAEFPLRGAKVTVVDVPGAPGSYHIIAHFVPHSHFSDSNVSISLVCRIDK